MPRAARRQSVGPIDGRRLIAFAGALVCLAFIVPAADAAPRKGSKAKPCRATKKGAVYHSPGYKGVCRASKTKPQDPLPPVELGDGGSSLVASWRRASGAQRYLVRLDVSDGRHLLRLVRGRSVRLSGVARTETVKVKVAGRNAKGRQGKAAKAKLAKARKKRH